MLTDIFDEYKDTVKHGLDSIDVTKIQEAVTVLADASFDGTNIFVCGNGASAAIAQHWACDFLKGSYNTEKQIGPRVIALGTNVPLLTAIGNDISYNQVFAFELEKLGFYGDVLVVVSSSGNSPNVIEALHRAKLLNMKTIALTGFNGGLARKLADINIHVDCQEYEATEDCHSFVMQCIAKYLRRELNARVF